MAVEIVMPKLGMAMKEGMVSHWRKQTGDPVSKGEIIADINSEKIEMEVESPADGVLLEIVVPVGQGVPPGAVICRIGNPDEQIVSPAAPIPEAKAHIAEAAASAAAAEPLPNAGGLPKRGEIKISPVARKMAEAAGIDIESLEGTGPQGRITKEDVERAMEKRSSAAPPAAEAASANVTAVRGAEQVEQTPVAGIRKVIASRMLDSLQQSAQLTLTLKADVTALLALQKQMSDAAQKQHGVKLTVTDFTARAVVLSLAQHKQMNSAYIDERIHTFGHVHLGVAVALEKGLVVPVVRHAETLSLLELARGLKSLAQRARSGQLGSDEMQGSTFTITTLGAFGIEHFTPVLNPPEAGILGIGAIQDTPVYSGDELQRRSLLPLSLTFDHRVLDGAPAAEFLRTLKQHLEDPYRLVL
ncbi:dihydrolipoamide acetyltransferase family protein [Paenibacillus hamazuiensis]|uniref:dihydrolipoamide acetyltransferase family protein n=1 Tax=Paenibacillus hamazuiensis TaxID=2936508 RepID=UPI00200D67FC|nr:dihydrolipoamide acetyltransferase family protein [Paenibacillus hamazuiensis]